MADTGDSIRQKFNDDLLIHKEDRDLAKRLYPTVLHVLDHPELRRLFVKYDEAANRAKRRSRLGGSIAIILATVALFCASGEVLFYESPKPLLFLAVVGVVSGISSVIIGSLGLLYGSSKREWLYRRLMTERLRQFHFQTFVSLLPDILDSLHEEGAKINFLSRREAAFAAFRTRMEGHLETVLTRMLGDEEPEHWFEQSRASAAISQDDPSFAPLLEAYRELRIEHQRTYADFKIRDDNRILSNAARRQATILESFGFACIVLLLSIDIAVGIAILIGWTAGAQPARALMPVLSAATIWIAVAALAARAFEQGLQPDREIERYQQYSSDCKAILERFDAAPSQAEKLRIIMDMERLSFDEMRNFLITNHRARFVM